MMEEKIMEGYDVVKEIVLKEDDRIYYDMHTSLQVKKDDILRIYRKKEATNEAVKEFTDDIDKIAPYLNEHWDIVREDNRKICNIQIIKAALALYEKIKGH